MILNRDENVNLCGNISTKLKLYSSSISYSSFELTFDFKLN